MWGGCCPVAGRAMSDFDLPQTRDWDAPALDAFAAACLFQRDARLVDVVSHCHGRLAYLASPYSKIARYDDGEWDPSESLLCADRAALWARQLAMEGVTAVSPIVQAVGMVHADFNDQRLDPLDVLFWEDWCRPLLNASGMVIVPPIAGWDYSDGIWVEVCEALKSQRRVFLIKPGEEFGGDE